jgi:hypothetical protein
MNPSPKPDSTEWEVVDDAPRARPEPPVLEPSSTPHGAPIHPLAATLLIVVDSLWLVADWNALAWILTIPLSFLSVFIPSTLIQRFLHGNSFGKALAFGAFLGVLAAVPTPILSTPAGLAALAWAGLSWLKKGSGKLTP